MSNIPEARRILTALRMNRPHTDRELDYNLGRALRLLKRKRPVMIAKRTKKPLTARQIQTAKRLRRTGMHQADIAYKLNVNPGRISELGI